MKQKQNKTTYFITIGTENFILSTLRDLKTFGFIIGSFYLNYKYLDGNNFVDMLLFLIAIIVAITIATKKHGRFFELEYKSCATKEEAIEFINQAK